MNKFKKHLLGLFILAISIIAILGSSPTTIGTVTLTPPEDDIVVKSSLKQYLKNTNNPTIVLRVPTQTNAKVLEENKYSKNNIYNTIEKEFVKEGFIVRDRAIYNKILDDKTIADYSSIKELTNTDLIFEIAIEEKVFNTNKYKDKKNREQTATSNISNIGLKIEYKFIFVKDNALVGYYTYYVTPCTNGCDYRFDGNGNLAKQQNTNVRINEPSKPYEFVSVDLLENIVKKYTKKLIDEMKK